MGRVRVKVSEKTMKRVRIPKALKQKLEKEAKRLGMDTDEFAAQLIASYIDFVEKYR